MARKRRGLFTDREGGDPIRLYEAEDDREEARFARVVLYSAATLERNGGTRSGDFDWEVVALLADHRRAASEADEAESN